MAPSPKKPVLLFLALSFMIAAVHGGCNCPTPSSPPLPPLSSSPPPPFSTSPPSSSSPPTPLSTSPPSSSSPPPPFSTSPPSSSPPPPSSTGGTCPINTLKLAVCANVLNLLRLGLGVPASEKCCPLLTGLANLDAAVCLCTALKANILGISLNVPLDLSLLLNQCRKNSTSGFTCPA